MEFRDLNTIKSHRLTWLWFIGRDHSIAVLHYGVVSCTIQQIHAQYTAVGR